MRSYDRSFKWEYVVSSCSSFPSDTVSTAWVTTKPTTLTTHYSLTCCLLLFSPWLFNSLAASLPTCRPDQFVSFLLFSPVADVLSSSVWVTSSASLWHINSTFSLAEPIQVTLHPLYIQRSPPKGQCRVTAADASPAHPLKKSQATGLSENNKCNLIQRRRCLYVHVMNSFIAVWRAPLRLQSCILVPWHDILQLNLSLRGFLGFHWRNFVCPRQMLDLSHLAFIFHPETSKASLWVKVNLKKGHSFRITDDYYILRSPICEARDIWSNQ